MTCQLDLFFDYRPLPPRKFVRVSYEARFRHLAEKKRAAEIRRKQYERDGRRRGTHTAEQWEKLVLFCGTCVLCSGKAMKPHHWLTRDHILPLSRGGSDSIENIQPACHRCNCAKQDRVCVDMRPPGWREAVL